MKKDAVRVGFAAETNNLIENARKKLNSKTLDLIIANMVSNDFNPFGNAENQVFLITKNNVKEIKKIDKETFAKINIYCNEINEIIENYFKRVKNSD